MECSAMGCEGEEGCERCSCLKRRRDASPLRQRACLTINNQRVHVTPRHTLHKYRAVHEHLFHLFFLRVSSRADKLEQKMVAETFADAFVQYATVQELTKPPKRRRSNSPPYP